MSLLPSALRECHRLRRHIRDLQAEIERGPRVQKLQQTRLTQAEAAHKEKHDAIKKLKLKQKDDEGSLKQTEQHLDKLHGRSLTVTTMKEMDATRSETAQANAKKGELEDAILAGMAEIEERTADLPTVEKAWAEAQAEFAESQAAGRDRLARMQEDLAASTEELKRTEDSLPATVRPSYDIQVKKHGADALAAVVKGVCQGCRTALTGQKAIEMKGGSFQLCSSCGKILYPGD